MAVEVDDLVKVYRVPVKAPGVWASLRSLVNREVRDVRAVDGVSFRIGAGERVGLLGPNGAGKTTTLKMLTGLLHPTSGHVAVEGHRPQDRAHDFLRAITLVMGQKQQLLWDLPATETFALNRALFDLDHAAWKDAVDELVELLDLSPFLDRPVRNLSLGQRMRCELAAALLHRPRLLFLDEPTIGLDVEVRATVRRFISTYLERHDATLVLTSHDMADVDALVDRVLLIDEGTLRFDGDIEALATRFGDGRRLIVRDADADLSDLGLTHDGGRNWHATVGATAANALLVGVLERCPRAGVTLVDPPLEDVLRNAFGRPETPAS